MEKSKELRDQIESYLKEELKNEPITEQPNRQTTNIDLSKSGREIFDLLEKTDREIFEGWLVKSGLKSEGLKDRLIIDKLTRLADLIGHRMKTSTKRFKVVLSGCGTSGRIAYLCAKTFNSFLGRDVCEYIIAGGDFALVNSVESVEDRPEIGEKELTR
jgi:N-acetylmuramic acid 6-phosphate (MurNAc-6-P) etherase